MFGVERKTGQETRLLEGEAAIFLKIEEHEYIGTHRLVRAPPLRFCGCDLLESRFVISGVEKQTGNSRMLLMQTCLTKFMGIRSTYMYLACKFEVHMQVACTSRLHTLLHNSALLLHLTDCQVD